MTIGAKRLLWIGAISGVVSGILVLGVFLLVTALVNAIFAPAPPARYWVTPLVKTKSVDEPICQGLQEWFASYNEQYFLGVLPHDTKVEYGDPDFGDPSLARMAVTVHINGRFHIILSKKYNLAPPVAHVTELHEMCHVETFFSDHSLDGHGRIWKDCMRRIENEGAFADLL
jgi:SprT-like family